MSVDAAPAAALDRPEEILNPRRWRALAVSLLAGFMSLLDVSIVNVAMPSMERDLHATPATLQWVVSGYAMMLGLTMVPAGRLGDLLGRRRMFLVALSSFALTSALSGLAPTVGLLVGARILQGVAGGMLLPQNSALIQDLFRGDERGRAFGMLGAVTALATATGPIVGGLVLTTSSGTSDWRWIFLINVPIGLLALVLAARLLPPDTRAQRDPLRLDIVGCVLLGAAVLSVLLPLVDASNGGLTALWPLLVVAVVLTVAFARWELRAADRGGQPVLDPELARTRGFASGASIGVVYLAGTTGIWLVLALFLQKGLGYTPLLSGLTVTPSALAMAVSAVISGRLVPRFGRWLTMLGLLTAIAGLLGTALVLGGLGGTAPWWAIAAPLVVQGLGSGMVSSPNTTMTLQFVPIHLAGAAGGALQTGKRIGSAVGAAGLVTVYYRSTASGHDPVAALGHVLVVGVGLILVAVAMAVVELRRSRQPAVSGR